MFLSKTIKIGFFLNHSGARVHLTWVITNMHKIIVESSWSAECNLKTYNNLYNVSFAWFQYLLHWCST